MRLSKKVKLKRCAPKQGKPVCLTKIVSILVHFYREILAEESNVQRVEFPVTVSKLHHTKYSPVPLCLGVWRHPWAVL